MKYKIEYDLSRCTKEMIRDFNINSVLEEEGIQFDSLLEFKEYVKLIKEMESDNSIVQLNEIDFRLYDIKYVIKDNFTICLLTLDCIDSKYVIEDDDDDDDLISTSDIFSVYTNKYLRDEINRYNKVIGKNMNSF